MDNFWTSAFWRDLNEGEINFRDNLQFELKSKFAVHATLKKNIFKQEFFMFIPETLQINRHTYLKDFFYMDQTNLIRYQTPVISLEELTAPQNKNSPFYRIKRIIKQEQLTDRLNKMMSEWQLLASIFRSALRKRVRRLILMLQKHQRDANETQIKNGTTSLIETLEDVKEHFFFLKQECLTQQKEHTLMQCLVHIEEYFIDTIDYYLTGYLDQLKHSHIRDSHSIQKQIVHLLTIVNRYRKEHQLMPTSQDPVTYQEAILHRNSLLNKFVLEALKLKTNRMAIQEKYGHALGAIAAGVAMFVYMTLFAFALFAWKSPPFIFTSFPIILIAVVLYMLKDRLKEGLKVMVQHRAFRWFPDYTTKIETPQGSTLGVIKENFNFIQEKELPRAFLKIRNEHFHEDLPDLKRHESIIEYKREVHLYQNPKKVEARRSDLNTIFRFNVHRLIQKANDSMQKYLYFDPVTTQLSQQRLPKVYHLNIIIRNTYFTSAGKRIQKIDTFRVVIDKTGIKRVEKIS